MTKTLKTIQVKVINILREISDKHDPVINGETKPTDLGLDSLDQAELQLSLEEHYDIDMDSIAQYKKSHLNQPWYETISVEEISKYIHKSLEEKTTKP